MMRSMVQLADGEQKSAQRTSSQAWIPSWTGIGDTMHHRVTKTLRVDRDLGESVQVVHYVGPQKYDSHYGSTLMTNSLIF
jgi:hypothetical protein